MAKAKAPKTAVGLLVIPERAHGYFHIYARAVLVTGNPRGFTGASDELIGGLYLDNLQTYSQGNEHDRADGRLYAFELGYDANRVTVREAGKIAKTLDIITKRLDKLTEKRGYVATYGEYVARVAETIGAETMFFKREGREGHYCADDDYFTLNLGDGRNKIDNLVWRWAEDLKAKGLLTEVSHA